jgi:ribonuclease T2
MSYFKRFGNFCHIAGLVAALMALAGPVAAQWAESDSFGGGWRPSHGSRSQGYGSQRPREDWGAQSSRSGRAATPGEFDFYVLALTWSAGFCELGGARKAREQCAGGGAPGFVVHGLWPQYERGFPSDCGSFDQPIPRAALNDAQGVFPDERLARYEWRKHGTCSGMSPSQYFAAVRRVRQDLVIPQQLAHLRGDTQASPMDVLRAFAESNRGLRPDMAAVGCRSGVLEEVRICYSKDLRNFVSCPEVARKSCRAQSIRIPAPQ